MAKILILTQRIPYPPYKGEKIRPFQFIKHWSCEHELYLGCFVDDANDWQYTGEIEKFCVESNFIGLNKKLSYLRMLVGLIRNKPLSVAFFYHRRLEEWIDQTIERVKPDIFIIFSSAMAQYIIGKGGMSNIQIMDFADVDADKWAQYARKSFFPMKWIYAREAKKLLGYDRTVANYMDASVFVTQDEVDLFDQLVPENQHKSYSISNGVDLEYFNDQHHYERPFRDNNPALVFTGTMNYKPNVDAVLWFVKEILPIVWRHNPGVCFYIVGNSPSDKVKALGKDSRIVVTGRVLDVRPFISYAEAVVAPLQIARGIQNKVLEAMAMNKIIIATSSALEGIDAVPGKELLLANDAQSFANYIVDVLNKNVPMVLGKKARECVEKKYSWQSKFEQYRHLIGLLSKEKRTNKIKASV